VERTTGPALVIMNGWPRFVVGLAPVVLLVLGLVLPAGIALIPLVVAFVLVLWLSYLSWPVVPPNARLIRILTLVLIVGIAVVRIANN
jgi:hypothetical protein